MNKIYRETSYKLLLIELIKDSPLTMRDVAGAIGVQPPFLSRVLLHEANLNDQQLYLTLRTLDVPQKFDEYIQILLQIDRSYKAPYTEYLEEKAKKIREDNSQLKERLKNTETISEKKTEKASQADHSSISRYYSDPKVQLVHMALLIPRYKKDRGQLAIDLGVSRDSIEGYIRILKTMGLIQILGQTEIVKERLHLDRSSYVSSVNHTMWRLEAMKTDESKFEDGYRFSATISADKAARLRLREKIRQLISDYSESLQGGKSKEIFQLNIDLFGLLG